jgi:hypothetical protein
LQETEDQYKVDVDDAIAAVANLTDLKKMKAEMFSNKVPLLQHSLDFVCKNCTLVSLLNH